MKNYVNIKDPKQQQIAMLVDHLKHLEALGDYADVQSHITQTKRELAGLGYFFVSYTSGWGIDGSRLDVYYGVSGDSSHVLTRDFPTQCEAEQYAFNTGYLSQV